MERTLAFESPGPHDPPGNTLPHPALFARALGVSQSEVAGIPADLTDDDSLPANQALKLETVNPNDYDLVAFYEDAFPKRNLMVLYNLEHDKWAVHPLPDELPLLSGHSSTVLGGRFCLFVNSSPASEMNEMMIYDMVSGECSEVVFYGSLPEPRPGAVVADVQCHRCPEAVYILGGGKCRDAYALPLAHLALRVRNERTRTELIQFLLSPQHPASQKLRTCIRIESLLVVRPAPSIIDQIQLL